MQQVVGEKQVIGDPRVNVCSFILMLAADRGTVLYMDAYIDVDLLSY